MLGILLMLAGVGLGFFVTCLSMHFASTGIRNFRSMWAGEIGLAEIKAQVTEVYQPLNESVRLAKLTNVGVYIYLPGIVLFALARRHRWKIAQLEVIQYTTNDTEQGVAGYRRQSAPPA